MHLLGPHTVAAQPGGYRLGQAVQGFPHLLVCGQVPGQRGAVANGFGLLLGIHPLHRGIIQAVGINPQGLAHAAQQRAHHTRLHAGNVPNGVQAVPPQGLFGAGAHQQQVRTGHVPDDLFHLPAAKLRNRVGLFVVAAQLGENFVKGHANGHGQAQLRLHPLADGFGNAPPIAKEQAAAVHIQPALVQTEGLHPVGVVLVNLFGQLRKIGIALMMGRHQLEARALAHGLPDGLGGLHAFGLGKHIFRQYNAVAAFLVPGHGHGHVPVLGGVKGLDRGVKVVHIHMQNAVFHWRRLPDLVLIPL